jgi:hypothetical protein
MKRISTAFAGGIVLSAALLVACGGGGGSSSVPGGPPSVPTNAPAGSPQSFSATDAVAIPSAAPGAATVPVALPSDPSGAAASAALPSNGSIPPDATIAATYSSSADSTLPALSAGRSVNGRAVRVDSTKDVVAYLKLQFSADVSLPQAPAFTFTVPRVLPTSGITYWLAFLDPLRKAAGWQLGFEGPATVSAATTAGKAGTQLAFASNGNPIAFTANQSYYFVVYAVSATAATPTPVPSSVPSNAPDTKPGTMGVTPRNLQFASITSTPAPITFVQAGFTGAFTLHGDCTGIVNTSGTSPNFTVTPVGVGRCVIVGLGDRGASAVVHVGVVTPYETPAPSSSPTAQPSATAQPSHSPGPTHAPTTAPTSAPSHSPEPTHAPTTAPTSSPSSEPSHSPEPTHAPTIAPSSEPSHSPKPTASPTPGPTHSPEPNASPSPKPV